MRRRAYGLAIAVAVLASGSFALAQSLGGAPDSGYLAGFAETVDDAGNIRVPVLDYRANWRLLGSWSIAGEEAGAGASGLHVVYTQPGVIEAYRTDGVFPEGAVLVKELYGTVTEDMTTGRVSRAAARSGWFVMVKDSSGRFEGSGLWGEGWGWAYFDAADPMTPVTEDFQAECIACHEPARDSDWIYVEGYPVLGTAGGASAAPPAAMHR